MAKERADILTLALQDKGMLNLLSSWQRGLGDPSGWALNTSYKTDNL